MKYLKKYIHLLWFIFSVGFFIFIMVKPSSSAEIKTMNVECISIQEFDKYKQENDLRPIIVSVDNNNVSTVIAFDKDKDVLVFEGNPEIQKVCLLTVLIAPRYHSSIDLSKLFALPTNN